jgi:hypothetical protein
MTIRNFILVFILRAVTDAENGNARNPYNLRPSASLKPTIVTARSISLLWRRDRHFIGF